MGYTPPCWENVGGSRYPPISGHKMASRRARHWSLFGSPWGLVITSREALLDRIQSELQGSSLLEELLIDRRREAAIEDAR